MKVRTILATVVNSPRQALRTLFSRPLPTSQNPTEIRPVATTPVKENKKVEVPQFKIEPKPESTPEPNLLPSIPVAPKTTTQPATKENESSIIVKAFDELELTATEEKLWPLLSDPQAPERVFEILIRKSMSYMSPNLLFAALALPHFPANRLSDALQALVEKSKYLSPENFEKLIDHPNLSQAQIKAAFIRRQSQLDEIKILSHPKIPNDLRADYINTFAYNEGVYLPDGGHDIRIVSGKILYDGGRERSRRASMCRFLSPERAKKYFNLVPLALRPEVLILLNEDIRNVLESA